MRERIRQWRLDIAFFILNRCRNLAIKMTGINKIDVQIVESERDRNEIYLEFYSDINQTALSYFPPIIRFLRFRITRYSRLRK